MFLHIPSTGCGSCRELSAPSVDFVHRSVRVISEHTFCHACKPWSQPCSQLSFHTFVDLGKRGLLTLMAEPLQAMAPLPPQNLEAEEYVLGAMMLSQNAIEAVSEIIDGGDFYRESHATIYRVALELFQHGRPVDAITLADKLDEGGELEQVGGKERIREIATLVPGTSNAAHHARIVREMATLRGLTTVGEGIQRLGWERPGETPELVDRAEQMVFDLAQHRIRGSFEHIEVLVRESFEQITKMYESGGEITGTPTGFRDVDQMTSGLQPGNLVVVAGRPSMGKSAFALGVASNLALHHGTPVAVFTLEMSKLEVAQRLMCSEGRVELQRLRTGRLTPEDWPRLVKACDALTKAPVYVDDTRLTTMLEIRGKARRLKAREPKLGLIMIDYLQLMTSGSSSENRVQEVSQISRSLKVLAGDLEVPVLALSQLSRAVESRTDKRPLLSDLRESGCLSAETRVYLPDDGVYRRIAELEGRHGFRVLAADTDTWQLEPRMVTAAFATGARKVYRLETRLGHRVRATANHKFLALDGWRRLDDLAPGMRVAVPRALAASGRRAMRDSDRAKASAQRGEAPCLPRARRRASAWGRVGLPGTHASAARMAALEPSPDRVSLHARADRRWTEVSATLARLESEGIVPRADSEIYWDEVVAIDPDGVAEVYDLTVEGLHNFVAEDVIVHNSIEQDADLVMFLYRDEYYNEQSDDQGLAEIILAKHRNGPVGTEKLAFLKRFAKFADLAPQHDARAAA